MCPLESDPWESSLSLAFLVFGCFLPLLRPALGLTLKTWERSPCGEGRRREQVSTVIPSWRFPNECGQILVPKTELILEIILASKHS